MQPDAFGGTYVANVVAHPRISGLLFAGRRSPHKGMGNGLFYSTNHGNSWKQMPGDTLSNMNIWSVNVNPHSGEVFAGTSHGVYRIVVSEAR